MRIGILGAGDMGSAHAGYYAQMPDVQVAGIVGPTEARVQQVASGLGVPGYTDPRRLLDDEAVEAIDLCYPTHLHAEYAIAALQRGKHVFCEVPMALTLEEADAMIAAAHAGGRLLLVAFVVRFVDANVYVREAVQAGRLGTPQVATLDTTFRMRADGPAETALLHYPAAGAPETPAIPEDPYWAECRYFVDCVAGRADPARIDATVARDALRVALAAEESWRRGGERVALA